MGDVARHYTRGGLTDIIGQALRTAGKDLDRLTTEDLAPVDEFHTRGRPATRELASLVGPGPQERVIDLGCGIGGPSRYLATAYGCHVTGIDVTPAYVDAATELARWVGLADRVAYEVADATQLPFADGRFDIAWTQHVAMNIADKVALYREAFRVLRPGGRFLVYDVLQGPAGAIEFPVPWASGPSISHLVTPAELDRLLAAAGFETLHSRDRTQDVIEWSAARIAGLQGAGPASLGVHLIIGGDAPLRFANLQRNLQESRALVGERLAAKPD